MINTNLKKYVQQLKKSDRAAFDAIFHLFQESIFNFLLYKTKSVDLSEDLLQEVFLKLWETRRKLNANKSIKTYLFTIANNLFLNHQRHQKVVQSHQEQQKSQGIFVLPNDPHFDLEEQEFQKVLMHAIEQLPEGMRTVFLMSRTEGLSSKEIAERLDISAKTVESHIYKALKLLGESIPKEYEFRKKRGKQNK